jgi:uncharacterized protein (DUF1501 family)
MFNRREFLSTVGLGAAVPGFLAKTAFAAGNSGEPGKRDTVLVMLQLTGGNDGLNTVIPFADPFYAQYRPTLKIAADQVKKINDSIGLHPAMAGFAKLLEKQSLCVVQGVGYPNPSQSHFRSMDIWQAGGLAEVLTEGWLGKALKKLPSGTQSFHLKEANQSSPFAFEGAPMRVPSIATISSYPRSLAMV